MLFKINKTFESKNFHHSGRENEKKVLYIHTYTYDRAERVKSNLRTNISALSRYFAALRRFLSFAFPSRYARGLKYLSEIPHSNIKCAK